MTELPDLHAHERFMRLALDEARIALETGDIPVGAVIVHDGEVVSTGRNATESQRNDLLHAEQVAVSRIPQFLWTHRRQCTLYTTLEPCAMLRIPTERDRGFRRMMTVESDDVDR